MSLLPMREALPVPSGWRFTSYPWAGGECCRAPQKKDLLVLHFQWSSSLSPTWNSTSQAISKRKFQACYMPFCSWLKSTSKAPNRPWHLPHFPGSAPPVGSPHTRLPVFQTHRDLSFSIACVSNGLWAHIHCPPLHLRVLNSAFKNSTPSRKKSTYHLAALKESFQGLLLWHSWYSFPPILLVSLF